MSIGNLWANGDGTVYLQGHLVIPNPWGDAVTNGTTTTTTDDTTDKSGGDDEGDCGSSGDCNPENRTGRRENGLFDSSWFRTVKSVYDQAIEENWDCDRLKQEKENWADELSGWGWHQQNGWGGNFDDYNPWDDLSWLISVANNYDPNKGDKDYYGSANCNTVRAEIGVLQTLDCLIKQKC